MATNESIMREMLERVINAQTGTEDSMASQMFCMIVKNDADLISAAHEMLVKKMYSTNTEEALRAVSLLEECMTLGGESFQNKTAKFAFLNRLIQLVSDQHNGAPVNNDIKKRIMNCLLLWTAEHPDKRKIRDTYDDLKKRNLTFDWNACTPIANTAALTSKRESFLGKDEDLIDKLLKKGGAENYKMANLLIKHRYNLESQRITANNEQKSYLNEIGNTVELLNEMLDNYKAVSLNDDDLETINMLFHKCKDYKTKLEMLQNMNWEMDDENIVNSTTTHDRLVDCINLYEEITSKRKMDYPSSVTEHPTPATINSVENMSNIDLLNSLVVDPLAYEVPNNDVAKDIFALPTKKDTEKTICETNATGTNMWTNMSLLEPIKILQNNDNSDAICKTANNELDNNTTTKTAALSELDLLSQELLQQSLNGSFGTSSFKKMQPIKPKLNDMIRNVAITPTASTTNGFSKSQSVAEEKFKNTIPNNQSRTGVESQLENMEEPEIVIPKTETSSAVEDDDVISSKITAKDFGDIYFDLDQVTSLAEGAITLINDGDFNAMLNFTMDRPMPQVTVIVLTVLNKSKSPIKNFQFHAAVKKPCKIRLLPPTDTDIAVGKPFRPAPPINQVLLLYNPTQQTTDVCCIFNYRLGESSEEFSEFAIAKDIPFIQ